MARYGRDLRYCYDFGKWLVWDGVRWALDRTGAALDQAKETARKMLAEAATLADKEDSRKLAAWSFRSQARDRTDGRCCTSPNLMFLFSPNSWTRIHGC